MFDGYARLCRGILHKPLQTSGLRREDAGMKRPSDESNVIMHATSKTLNFMLDSNAHDAILHHGLSKKIAELVGTGRIVILTTHIQQDEIAETPDLDKRANLQSIGAKRVATSGALWGLSRWGAAEFGDGSGDVK